MSTTTDDAPKGPSKGELKKLAKKAEKASMSNAAAISTAAATATAASAVATTSATTTATAAEASKSKMPSKQLLLVNASPDSLASVKAMWASLLFQVPLTPGKGSLLGNATETALVLGDQVTLGSGGNSMVHAIRWMSPYKNTIVEDSPVDEWCEWERTILRKSPASAIATLATKLIPGQHHLVGHDTTVADIVVASTLSTLMANNQLPLTVQTYLDSHATAIASAKEHLATFGKSPPLDMNESSLDEIVTAVFRNALIELYGNDITLPTNNWIAKCANPKHGDYQCTAAMSLFKALAGQNGISSPQDIAKALVEILGTNHPVVSDVTVNGPGFVLCRVQSSFLQHHVQLYLQAKTLPKPRLETKTCLVDFSSPNIAKEMHVGHLRSTILGESVARILEAVGYTVHRVNHVGDWGTQFGMLIQYLKETCPTLSTDGDLPNITDLTVFYKNAKQRFDDDAEFKKIAQMNVVKLQSGDEECLKIWKILCDISRKEFQKVYDRLDVKVYECGESFYNDKIPAVIAEFEQAGMIQLEEGGAKCVFLEGAQIPLMLQKSDGGYGYDSTDMAALKYRLHTIKAERIIAITDFSQGDHFKMCNQAARNIGWVTNNQSLEHIGFGTVQGEDGKRFKTRSGDTVRLVDLLDEAVHRMEATLNERIAEGKASITPDEVHTVAEAMGYSAVRYFDLRRNPTTNYKFSYDQMLDTKGNTAVYLLYAHARLASILTKAKDEHGVNVDDLDASLVIISHASERNLALQLQQFTDILALTLEDLYPYHICEYLYNLSTTASEFCTQCKVLGSPEMSSRLLLCKSTTMAMRECFDLLGIRHVQRI